MNDAAAREPGDPVATVEDAQRRRWLAAGFLASLGFAATPARAARIVRPWPAARPVPALDLPDLDGRAWRLAEARGKVVLLNFWATWCEPCRAEMPSLLALAEARRAEGLAVCAVNYRESPEKIRAFLEPRLTGLRVMRDADGDAAVEWTPRVFPTTVLVGRDGVPVLSVIGELDWMGAEAEQLLRPLLAAPAPAARAS